MNIMIQFISFDSKSTVTGTMQLVRICIEVWKLYRLFGYKYCWILIQHQKTRFVIRMIPIQHPALIKRGEEVTKRLDSIALQYIIWLAAPLLFLFGSSFIATFGYFFMILPQLYINYQMGRVNHISVNTMIYKSLTIAIGKREKKNTKQYFNKQT